jgi:hypothetical protein
MGLLRKLFGTSGTIETIGTGGSGSWLYFKNHSLHERRRIAQSKNLPAQLIIGHLSGDAGEFFSVDGYFHSRIFDHVLTPVLAVDFARRGIIAALVVNKAEFYGPRSAGFSSNRCQSRGQSRSISKIHVPNISGCRRRDKHTTWLLDSVARAGLS